MDEQNMDILERIHASYYQLTAAERKVADYVLTQHSQVQFMSITQLADECGTAEATISRFCRSLKLKGFNAFKIELARYGVPAAVQTKAHSTDTPAGRCQEVGRLATEAVHQTIEQIQPQRDDVINEPFHICEDLLSQSSAGLQKPFLPQWGHLDTLSSFK